MELEKRTTRKVCTERLIQFHRHAWHVIDPAPYSHNWHLEAIAEHLEAVTFGDITRLLINIPPRCSKSLLVSVSWPAWVWAQMREAGIPLCGSQVQFLFASYSQVLSQRDSLKMRRLIASPWYQQRWGNLFQIRADKDTERKFENTKGGYRLATSVDGTLTGEGGDVIVVDDPLNAKQANYETVRNSANEWWDESMSTRLNNQTWGAKVVVMQRLHEDDLSGHIIDRALDEEWDTLVIPMEFDGDWREPTSLGWKDPREEDGELLWPERFPAVAIERLKRDLGPFAASGQLQQSPAPRGGGIIDRQWWRLWPPDVTEKDFRGNSYNPNKYPPCSLIVGSIDTAYGKKDENAWNAMTTWGVWTNHRERPQIILMEAWRMRGPLRGISKSGEPLTSPGGDDIDPEWGLAERIMHTVRRRQIEILLIENKTRGSDLEFELRQLLRSGECSVVLLDPDGDKVARLHACQSLFADGMVWAPQKAWSEVVLTEVSQFPKSKWADYVDTVSQALSYLRREGMLRLGTEADEDNVRRETFRPIAAPLYDV